MALLKNLIFTSEWLDSINGKSCKYRFKLYERFNKSIVIASDYEANDGNTITDCIEKLANRFCHTYKIDHNNLVMIAEKKDFSDRFHIVDMTWDGRRFHNATWRVISQAEVEELINEKIY
ncbi:conserved hypothetical protein [Desulfovibrionales bacterium]